MAFGNFIEIFRSQAAAESFFIVVVDFWQCWIEVKSELEIELLKFVEFAGFSHIPHIRISKLHGEDEIWSKIFMSCEFCDVLTYALLLQIVYHHKYIFFCDSKIQHFPFPFMLLFFLQIFVTFRAFPISCEFRFSLYRQEIFSKDS